MSPKKPIHSRWYTPVLMVCMWAAPAIAEAQSASDANLAKRLATVRAEVESLSDELAEKSADMRDEMRSYGRQKMDLELEVQREKTRLQKIRAAIDREQKEVEDKKAANQSLEPLFKRNLVSVRAYVKGTLPFRTSERLAELDKIEQQVKSSLLTPQKALTRLWSFVEDELRLTRESGMYRQTVNVDGKEQLADVIRVGMVALFFRTNDERYGFINKLPGGWDYKTVGGGEDRKRVRKLFEDFQKQIRVGYFELPNALVAEAVK